MKRISLALVTALALLVLSVPWRPATIDRDGYSRPRSVWDLFAPPVEGFYRASIIKSIQTGTITINTGTTTGTATLTTAVSSTSTIIVPGHTTTAVAAGWNAGDATFALTNPTTVTMTCVDDGISSPTCEGTFTAVEFYPNVLSATGVQRGIITLSAAQTSNTATITSVVTSKTALVPCGFRTNGNVTSYRIKTKQVLTNATTVTASRYATDGASSIFACWQVAEFK